MKAVANINDLVITRGLPSTYFYMHQNTSLEKIKNKAHLSTDHCLTYQTSDEDFLYVYLNVNEESKLNYNCPHSQDAACS